MPPRSRSHRAARLVVGALALATAALAAAARPASAQAATDHLRLRASAADSARVDGGSVVTVPFTVTNDGSDSAHVRPLLTTPRGWRVLMGEAPFSVAPGSSDTWLVVVSVPGSAAAATYVVRAALQSGTATVTDSVPVHVNAHREIDVLSLAVPGWVMAGSRYEARFLVRNRGNVTTVLNFSGSTARGTGVETSPRSAALEPGASAAVVVRVASAGTSFRATDDVLELTAISADNPKLRVEASARTTLVPQSGGSSLATVPALLSLRSIGGASGVSPVVLTGGGLMADSSTRVDFSLHAPVGQQSPYGFSERDEYRANFRNDRFALRLGDNVYGFSPLTTGGAMGTGAEFSGLLGAMDAGVYAQHLRWLPGSISEAGLKLGTSPDSARGLLGTFVQRESGGIAVSVGSVGGHLRFSNAATLQLEAAASDSSRTAGLATRARLAGSVGGMSYDVGTLNAGSDFSGLTRGTSLHDGVLSMKLWRRLVLGASGTIRVTDFATPLSGIPAQHFSTANVNLSYGGWTTLEYGWLSRHDDGPLTPLDGTQRGLRATNSLPLGPASMSVSYERGMVNPELGGEARSYDVVTLSAQTRLGNAGTFSLFGAHNDGTTLLGATSGVANAGVSLHLRLPYHFELDLATSAQRATLGVFDGSGAWFSQSDARLDYFFAGGEALSLRERIWQNPIETGNQNARAIYLEFRTPIRLPIGAAPVTGTAEGVIVDAETGAPLAGALVRIGDDAEVTNRNGRVFFNGLPAARQRISVEATGAAAGALLVGDAFVDLRGTQSRPATFSLAMSRGGSVRAAVRVLARALGELEAGSDTLVTAGMQPDLLLALVNGRDTLYETTDGRGRADFGLVHPGAWTLLVMPGDIPEHYQFEEDRLQVTVQPGKRADAELRLVPQRRATKYISAPPVPLIARPPQGPQSPDAPHPPPKA